MARARSNTGLPGIHMQVAVAVLAADHAGLGEGRAEFAGLVVEAPQRRADRHRGQLAAGVLVGPGHAGEAAIFLGQARVEHAAEVDIAGRAAGGDDRPPCGRGCCSVVPVVVDARCRARGPAFGASRWIAVILCSSRISTPAFCAAASSGRIRPLPEEQVVGEPPDRPACRSAPAASPSTAQCISRGTELPTELPPRASGALSTKTTPCASSHSKVGDAVVGEGADDLAVVVAVVGEAVGLDDRPVGQVAEQQVGRVLDAVFLLHAGAAAERNVAAAGRWRGRRYRLRPRRG